VSEVCHAMTHHSNAFFSGEWKSALIFEGRRVAVSDLFDKVCYSQGGWAKVSGFHVQVMPDSIPEVHVTLAA